MRYALFLLPALAACRHDTTPPPPDPGLLTGNYRKLSETEGGQNLWCTYYQDSCALDNRYRFERDGRYLVLDEGLTCPFAGEPGGQWELAGDSLRLPEGRFKVLALDGRELWLAGTRTRGGWRTQVELRYRRE